jgi:hypothetical protein
MYPSTSLEYYGQGSHEVVKTGCCRSILLLIYPSIVPDRMTKEDPEGSQIDGPRDFGTSAFGILGV